MLRSVCGAGFPLFAEYMFKALGVNWAGTLLGCGATIMIPIPVAFWLWGPKLRAHSRYAPTD
jgi:DHA1 family multidrug resistance protein-like MFS transporter